MKMTRMSSPARGTAPAKNLMKLHQIIESGLIGKKCWRLTVSSGELVLHMGARRSYNNAKMTGEKKGEWIFGTCGTRWILVTPTGTVRSDEADAEMVEEKARVIE